MRIKEAIGILTSISQDWEGFLVNPRFIRNDNTISWIKFSPEIYPYQITDEYVGKLAEAGQYSFQVEDGSLIQLLYNYDRTGNNLEKAQLGYYSYFNHTDRIDDWQYNEIGQFNDFLFENPILTNLVSWIRIDFDPSSFRGIMHSSCHLHISGFPNTRLVVKGIPNPKQFVEFIISMFYSERFSQHRLNNNGLYVNPSVSRRINQNCFPFEEHEIFQCIPHFLVPSAD